MNKLPSETKIIPVQKFYRIYNNALSVSVRSLDGSFTTLLKEEKLPNPNNYETSPTALIMGAFIYFTFKRKVKTKGVLAVIPTVFYARAPLSAFLKAPKLPFPVRTFHTSHEHLTEKVKQVESELEKLRKSYEVQTVWPEAFLDGNTCSLHVTKKMADYPSTFLVVKEGYLRRSDGEIFPLTEHQLRILLE